MRVLSYNAKQWEIPALLDGRKTVTRRVVRYKYSNTEMQMRSDKYGTRLVEIQKDVEGETYGKNEDGSTWRKLRGYIEPKPPCKPGDILYVRETWSELVNHRYGMRRYVYKASDKYPFSENGYIVKFKWKSPVTMPKAAARIWLKVTDVRVERLQDITEEQAIAEGTPYDLCGGWKPTFYDPDSGGQEPDFINGFSKLWDSTIKKSDLDRYGWDANPWV